MEMCLFGTKPTKSAEQHLHYARPPPKLMPMVAPLLEMNLLMKLFCHKYKLYMIKL